VSEEDELSVEREEEKLKQELTRCLPVASKRRRQCKKLHCLGDCHIIQDLYCSVIFAKMMKNTLFSIVILDCTR